VLAERVRQHVDRYRVTRTQPLGSSGSYLHGARCVTRFVDVTGLHPSSIRCLLHVRGVVVVLGKSMGRIDWCTGRIGGSDGDERVCAGSSLVCNTVKTDAKSKNSFAYQWEVLSKTRKTAAPRSRFSRVADLV